MSLHIRNLSKNFNDKTIFTDFSYTFDDKGIYLLLGESGVGKTTLLRIIAGLDKDYSGEILGGGIGRVSFAFQEYRLFPALSALENVIIATADDDEAAINKASALLSNLGFSYADMDLLPSELSGGMKQRVSLARAFMKKAPILLLDEPTKELDAVLCKRVCEIIKNVAEDRLVIVVTHKADDIRLLGGEQINL